LIGFNMLNTRRIARTLQLFVGLSAALLASAVGAQNAPVATEQRVTEIVESRCALCHGREGVSSSPIYPRLAAQHPDYMFKQLQDFREKRRKSDTMSDMVKGMKDEEFRGLVAWFSSRKPAFRQPSDTDLADVGKYIFTKGNPFSGVPACASCHGPNGHGTQQLPRLAGQHPVYLESQLKDFGERERTNDNAVMHSIASKLTALETHAVAVFIGGLQ
jgi:cytochrome c553